MKRLLLTNSRSTILYVQVILLLIVCAFTEKVQSQNLVINPSFEDSIIPCNIWQSGLAWPYLPCYPWQYIIDGSPDFYHTFFYCGYINSPSNFYGYHTANSGFAYEAIGVYTNVNNDQHEFLGGLLINSLQIGHQYCISFYVSPANNFKYLIGDFGIYLSSDSIKDTTKTYPFPYIWPYVPQVESSIGIIDDTLNWTKVFGYFNAIGGERYFAIGNFKSDVNTNLDSFTTATINNLAYYYVDDVSVIDCTVGIPELPVMEMSISPNPAGGSLYLTFANYRASDANISIRDVAGRLVLERRFTASQKPREINIVNLRSGMYFLTFQSEYGRIVKRFVKMGDG